MNNGEENEKEIECCNRLEISTGKYAHQVRCEYYDGIEDADKLHKALKGVTLGIWADMVLDIHGKRGILNMTPNGIPEEFIKRDPEFIDLPDGHRNKEYENSLVVEWVLQGVTLTIARGFVINPMTGKRMSVYAVQEIRSNNERKRPLKPKPRRN